MLCKQYRGAVEYRVVPYRTVPYDMLVHVGLRFGGTAAATGAQQCPAACRVMTNTRHFHRLANRGRLFVKQPTKTAVS
jgi:hypothetical protein